MKKRFLAIGSVVCALLCVAALSGSAETPSGYRVGEVVLIEEPDTRSADLTAYREGETVAMSALNWVDGVHGQALQLNGQSDYLEYTGAAARAKTLSGAAWINWQGSVTDDRTGEIGQRLWTLYQDEENYFSVCLRGYRDNIKEVEGGTVYRIDGVYMEYVLSGVMGRHVEAYNPTTRDMDYAIPQNAWTHVAFTLSDTTMRLYIDGRLWFEESLENAAPLSAAYLRIGGSVGGDPTLNAILDDVALFPQALDEASIRMLAQGAALDFTGATEPTTYRPVKPTEPEDASEEEPGGLRIPLFAWIAVGAVAAVFVVAIVAVNLGKKEEDDT